MKKEWMKVDEANMNIARELSVFMKKKDGQGILMEVMEKKKTSFDQDRENLVQKQGRLMMELEEKRKKVLTIPTTNLALELEIVKLKEKVKVSKDRKMKQDAIYNETEKEFENVLKNLVKQQKELQGAASNDLSEDNSLSQSSDIQQIEKVDVTIMSSATLNSFVS